MKPKKKNNLFTYCTYVYILRNGSMARDQVNAFIIFNYNYKSKYTI